MKLYFPTSSLNFNDIFATESISPKIFYQERNFGTRRHFQTEMSFNDNFTTLFSKIPYFQLVKGSHSEYEEYPLVFELDIDPIHYEIDMLCEGIYITSRTIYLSKADTKVLFFSETDLNKILVKSRLVNETKLVQKYMDRFEVQVNLGLCQLEIPKDRLSFRDIKDKIRLEIEKDKIFNSIKGLYYGYISKRYMDEYNNRNLRYKINLEGVLKIEDALSVYKKTTIDDNEVVKDALIFSLKYARIGLEAANKKFDEVISTLDVFKLNKKSEIIFKKMRLTDEERVYQIISNCILNNPKTRVGDIEKEEISDLISLIGQKITEEFGEKSAYRKDSVAIYNKIVKRIFEVDISFLSSNVLQNFLVFVSRYNNIDEMDKYIKYKNIQNGYIAYSFLGAFLGFSGLSRIITNAPLMSDSEELFEITDNIMNKFRNNIWCGTKQDTFIYDYHFNREKWNVLSNKSISLPKEDKSELYETNLLDLSKSCNNEKNCTFIRKQIFDEIRRIKKNSKIMGLMKKPKFSIDEQTEVTIEQLNSNIEITVVDLRSDAIINVWLKHSSNVQNEEFQAFKDRLKEIEVEDYKKQGHYITYEYNKTVNDEVFSLNFEEEEYLLQCLRKI